MAPAGTCRSLLRSTVAALVVAVCSAAGGQAQGVVTSGGALAMQAALPAQTAFRQAVAAASAEDEVIAGFYRDRDYRPLWTDSGSAGRRAALVAALEAAWMHALPEGRHDAASVLRMLTTAQSEGDRGRAEVAMTRAFLAYARSVQTGILTPSAVDKGIVRTVPLRDPRAQLDAFAMAEPAAFLAALPPHGGEYARLVKARLALLDTIAGGGWGGKVPAASLRPGQQGPAVVALRDRLMRMGYLGRTATMTYDAAIQAAVLQFQFDHGLTADGVVGETTMAEINQPPESRLRAITVAMERERWSNIDRGTRHIWVNLTDFTAKIIDDGKVTFSTRAVVGSTIADKRTPEFSDQMTYMEVNPDWTVPPGIIRRDYLPRLQANPGALGHLQVVDSRGRVVPRSAVNFAAYTAGNFPYNLRQPPGPTNSLGRVKFMFPNPWSIYLHDTPDKHLFQRESRAYSSGCVRLNDPFDFAYVLLAPQESDPKTAFHSVLDSGRQERILLRDPVPVHLDYRTAFTSTKGRVNYRRDIYGRDAAIWKALADAGVAQVAEGS